MGTQRYNLPSLLKQIYGIGIDLVEKMGRCFQGSTTMFSGMKNYKWFLQCKRDNLS